MKVNPMKLKVISEGTVLDLEIFLTMEATPQKAETEGVLDVIYLAPRFTSITMGQVLARGIILLMKVAIVGVQVLLGIRTRKRRKEEVAVATPSRKEDAGNAATATALRPPNRLINVGEETIE